MAELLEAAHRVSRHRLLGHDLVRQPLVMDARRGDRGGDVHAEIDRVEDHLQRRRDDAAAAGRAGDEIRLAGLEHDRRRHRGERPLARPGRIGGAADEAVRIGGARLGGEVVELVVEQDAGALGHQPDPERQIERVGVGDGVAGGVDDGIMRRVRALDGDRLPGADLARGRRALGVDRPAQVRRVALGREALDRNRDHVRIAQELGAVRIGPLHGLDHHMQRRHRTAAELRERIAFEHVEHLDQMHAAR